jgi:hypothetical protein
MERGYVNSGSGIFWMKKKHKKYLPLDAETLIGSRIFSYTGGLVIASRCPKCEIVIDRGTSEEILNWRDKDYVQTFEATLSIRHPEAISRYNQRTWILVYLGDV